MSFRKNLIQFIPKFRILPKDLVDNATDCIDKLSRLVVKTH